MHICFEEISAFMYCLPFLGAGLVWARMKGREFLARFRVRETKCSHHHHD